MIDFKIVMDSGDEFEVTASGRDVLNWEKTTKGASMKALMDELKMTDLYKVAFFASKRTGNFTGTLQEFEAQADLVFEVPDADPTP